jgi:hypothetical protein
MATADTNVHNNVHFTESQHIIDNHFGDELTSQKEETILRITCSNLDTLPSSHRHRRNGQISDYCNKYQIDMLGMTELNRHWRNMPAEDHLHERFHGTWETLHSINAYNTRERPEKDWQVGGTAMLSINQAAHRMVASGRDPSGLGRWVWTRQIGKGGLHLRTATLYRPCKNNTGPLTVYSQHQNFFDSKVATPKETEEVAAALPDTAEPEEKETLKEQLRAMNPRDRLLHDLGQEIEIWRALGDQILVMGDFNEDVRGPVLTDFFAKFGMRNIIQERHGTNMPATHQRGSVPVDGMFATARLTPERSGYTAFVHGVGGDHRLPWADFSFVNALGHVLPAIERPVGRRLRLHDPRIVARFVKLREDYDTKHNLSRRMFEIEHKASYPPTAETNAQYQKMDLELVESMRFAEKRCRKIRRGALAFSPRLKEAELLVILIKELIKRRLKLRTSSRNIRRMQAKLGDTKLQLLTLEQLRLEEIKAYRDLTAVQDDADGHRDRFLEQLAQAKADASKTTAEKHLQAMRQREAQRKVNAKMRKITGKGKRHSVQLLTREVTDNQGNRRIEEAYTTEDMETFALEEYESRLHRTENKPPMQEPLVDDLKYLGIGQVANQILEGTYKTPPGTDPHAAELIQQLKWACPPQDRKGPPAMFDPNDSLTIKTEDHIAGWKRAKERTAPGHSGLTTAHWKASCSSKTLAPLDASWANYPYTTGCPPLRWERGVDLLIPKKKEDSRVENNRPICLFEVDCNQNHKRLGRELMKRAEAHHGIAKEQYGSRKKHASADQALNKRLTFDILRQERRSAVDTAVDLASCYDLVVHSIASLSIQRQGVPEQPIVCMFTTLQNMEHTVRTAAGESMASFGGKLWAVAFEHPPQGLNQGNGAGPGIWAVVSTPVLEMLRKNGFGATFEFAISGGSVRLVGFAFVDDSDIIQTAATLDEHGSVLNARAQEAIDNFVFGMRATGGEVQPIKCWWYQIEFVWHKGKWTYKSAADCPYELTVPIGNGQRTKITQMDPSDAAETLGVWLAPDGNNKQAIIALLEKSTLWADKVRTGYLTPSEAWLSMSTTISKQLEYPLLALTLSAADCKRIEAPMLQQTCASSFLFKGFPRAIIDAPLEYHGLDRRSLYFSQGSQHIEALIKHGDMATMTGDLFKVSLERHALELGLPTSIFDTNFDVYGPVATDTWCKHTWEFMHKHDITIAPHTNHIQLKLQRENDTFLMQTFAEAGYKGAALKNLNNCRMFLQVITLSDISSGDGQYILPFAQHLRQTTLQTSNFKWPANGVLTPVVQRLWKVALARCFLKPEGNFLRRPLGAWLATAETGNWYYSPSAKHLFQNTNNGWIAYQNPTTRALRVTSAHRFLQQPGTATAIPDDILPTKVFKNGSDPSIRMSGTCATTPQPPTPEIAPFNLRSQLQLGVQSTTWHTQVHQLSDQGETVARAILNNDAIAVSDGSYKHDRGAAGLVLQEGFNKTNRIRLSNVIPGTAEAQSSYRSELGGIYGIVCVVELLATTYGLTDGSITIGCDGQEALWQSLTETGTVSTRASDFDLITAIRRKVARSPITFHTKWVQGHQDSLPGRHRRLDPWALLNVEMDLLAKDRLARQTLVVTPPDNTITDEPWQLWLGNTKVSNNLTKQLYTHVSKPTVKKYWAKRLPDDTFEEVDWKATGYASRNLPQGHRVAKTKRVVGMLGVGKFLYMWKIWDNSKCPQCEAPMENMEHVLKCPKADDCWASIWASMLTWFSQHPTYPSVIEAIYDNLVLWREGSEEGLDLDENSPAAAAIKAQTRLGWRNFLDGFLAREWRAMQTQFYEDSKSRRSSLRWVSLLIRQCWTVSQKFWQHRNKAVHAEDADNEETLTLSLNNTIHGQFDRGPDTMPRNITRHLFRGNIHALLRKSTGLKRQWLSHIVEARERQLRIDGADADEATLAPERQLLKSWLTLHSHRRQFRRNNHPPQT